MSSKRAARENKYHIDYIGQLIRAGKINGKKVGRAWYVEEASLNKYLAQESGVVAPIKVMPAPEPVQEEPIEMAEDPIEVIEVEAPAPIAFEVEPEPTPALELVQEPAPEPEVAIAEEVHETQILKEEFAVEPIEPEAVPVEEEKVEQKINITIIEKKPYKSHSNLIYVEDTEPLMPVLHPRVRENADFVAMPTKRSADIQQDSAVEVDEEENKKEIVQTITKKKSYKGRIVMLVSIGIIFLVLAVAGAGMLATSIKVTDGQPESVGFSIK